MGSRYFVRLEYLRTPCICILLKRWLDVFARLVLLKRAFGRFYYKGSIQDGYRLSTCEVGILSGWSILLRSRRLPPTIV